MVYSHFRRKGGYDVIKCRNFMPEKIILRAVTDDDEAFLAEVYYSSRRDEVSAFGWDEAQQDSFLAMQFSIRQLSYAMQYPDGEDSVILYENEPAGRIIIGRSGAEISLIDIAVLPQFQGNGIGSEIISRLKQEAANAAIPVVLTVDLANPKAFALYQKLGFAVSGETQLNYSMQWTPEPK
ncbi:hypothetical protein BH10ACI3_BH10ACI3_21130 [soil metagenome]